MMDIVNQRITDPKLYADNEAYRALFARIRREDPVLWAEPEGYAPFWIVSKHADIMEVERQAGIFLNRPRGMLQTIADTDRIKQQQGGSRLMVDTIVSMDGDDHKLYRALTRDWFLPKNVGKMEDGIREIARDYVDTMLARGGACDFVKDVAKWFPLRVITKILGVPARDEPQILQMAMESFGFADPDIAKDAAMATRFKAMGEFFAYFTTVLEDRRNNPRDDLASVIANGTIRGQQIGRFEALSYYVIIASAGHDTTSSSISGGLLALMQHPKEMERLRSDPELTKVAVEEIFRWVSPVKHFFRTATRDYELRGRLIKEGDSLMMCYPSGNFDEEVFEDAETFRIDRTPNRHVAFGFGPHQCLGQPLARLEVAVFLEELLQRIDNLQLAGETTWMEASLVSGPKSMPLRFEARAV